MDDRLTRPGKKEKILFRRLANSQEFFPPGSESHFSLALAVWHLTTHRRHSLSAQCGWRHRNRAKTGGRVELEGEGSVAYWLGYIHFCYALHYPLQHIFTLWRRVKNTFSFL